MSDTVIKATHGSPHHPLIIGDIEIPCYVLEDGQRVIAMSGMMQALDISAGGASKKVEGDRLSKFVSGKIIAPFISAEVNKKITSPIKFKTTTGKIAYGYEATILSDICDAILQARKEDVLQKQQAHIADKCEILVRGFARVGIIALVDEATGYQEVRARNELNKILEAYVRKEYLKWTRRFPNEFYKELFRLWGWKYDPLSVKRPQYVGKLTEEIVYKRLPPGVLDELKNKNPKTSKGYRKYRHHQFLTEDIGHPHLEKHLAAVIALMRISPNKRIFLSNLKKAFPLPLEQIELDLEDED